jgi:hypothetical protein
VRQLVTDWRVRRQASPISSEVRSLDSSRELRA